MTRSGAGLAEPAISLAWASASVTQQVVQQARFLLVSFLVAGLASCGRSGLDIYLSPLVDGGSAHVADVNVDATPCLAGCIARGCGESDGCGGVCQTGSCPSGQDCVDARCSCTAASCAQGCCAEGACVTETTAQQCGTGGLQCEVCTTVQRCVQGTCGPTAIIYGGEATSGAGAATGLSDTWAWGGNEWTQLNVAGPPARTGATMAALNGNLVLFGGVGFSPVPGEPSYADTWIWNGAVWTELAVAGPAARGGAVMASLGDQAVLFGGAFDPNPGAFMGNDTMLFADTWAWNGVKWTELSAGGPPARQAAVLAPLNHTLVLFGGLGAAGVVLGDTWIWDGVSWNVALMEGPPARYGAVMAPFGGGLLLLGGTSGLELLSDVWKWDGSSWQLLSASSPPDNFGAAMAPAGGELVLAAQQTWTWGGTAWAPQGSAGLPKRTGAVMATP